MAEVEARLISLQCCQDVETTSPKGSNGVSRIQRRLRLEQHEVRLFVYRRQILYTARDDDELTSSSNTFPNQQPLDYDFASNATIHPLCLF
jgi:hypothetical protein